MDKKILLLFFIIALWFGSVHQAKAQPEVQITSQTPNYQFGQYIEFQAKISSESPPKDIQLILEAPGLSSFVGEARFTAPDRIQYKYSLTSRPLPAFSTVVYRYRVTFESGETYTSQDFSFQYIDNRYTWQELEDGDFWVSWYEGDVTFAQKIMDVARDGKQDFESLFPNLPEGPPVKIYVYASASELQSTLLMTGQTWVAGHADAELGAIVVSITPSQESTLEIKRQVPHELAHILLYRIMGEEYQYLPRWLNEGIASQMEAFPNPDYRLYLEKAHQENRLIPIEELCLRFPSDAADSFLAYAESDSLIAYLLEYYGAEGIRKLISTYETGVGCSRGVEIALEKDLQEIERDWQRESLGYGSASRQVVEASLGVLPWFVIFGAVFAPMAGFVIFNYRRSDDTERGGE